MSPILQNHYVLAVHDVRRSAAFYTDVLGFRVVNEPPGWVFVAKDHCMIMLGECPEDMPASDLGCHSYFAYLRVADADTYYQHVKACGAAVLSCPRSRTSLGECASSVCDRQMAIASPSATSEMPNPAVLAGDCRRCGLTERIGEVGDPRAECVAGSDGESVQH
jgi:predicted enzyme related to lactoylglutathione lyase